MAAVSSRSTGLELGGPGSMSALGNNILHERLALQPSPWCRPTRGQTPVRVILCSPTFVWGGGQNGNFQLAAHGNIVQRVKLKFSMLHQRSPLLLKVLQRNGFLDLYQ